MSVETLKRGTSLGCPSIHSHQIHPNQNAYVREKQHGGGTGTGWETFLLVGIKAYEL